MIETGTNHRSTTGQGKMNSAKEAGAGCTEEAPFKLVLGLEQEFHAAEKGTGTLGRGSSL